MKAYSLPVRDDQSPFHSYHHHFEVIRVLDEDAGPCEECGTPMVRLLADQHVTHSGYTYKMQFDHVYAHADGSASHPTGFNRPKPQCPKCKRHGTVMTKLLAYGDRTDCSACGYSDYYSIGD